MSVISVQIRSENSASPVAGLYGTDVLIFRGVAEMFFYILYEYLPGWRFYITATLYVPLTILFIFLLFFQI